jgi:soluble lytic murein transglycosylase
LTRAELLAEGKRYEEALVEFEKLPAELPAELAAERDFELGMAKFRMRNDYPRAAQLLLGVAPRLSGDKAAFAAFHGARALSRVDRDDEAIAEYGKVVERFPSSRWAAEAQFLSGRLEFNRGRYREALPGLRATLARFGKSAFANDAAWILAFCHHLLGQPTEALAALDQYARLSGADQDAARRVLYWRGRFLVKAGKTEEGRALLRESVRRWPLQHYGLLARARLRAEGQPVEAPFEKSERVEALPAKAAAARDPVVERADELLAAGMAFEAGYELERNEETFARRVGREAALAVLFDRYPRMESYRRARQLAEGRGAAALASAPNGPARVYWEAAFPRAFQPYVEKYSGPAGVPDLYLYATMHKESAFARFEVSPADARGLVQLIVPKAREAAATLGISFEEDDLFDAETSIKLGATFIGGLARTFRGQVFLTAAAYNAGHKATRRWCDQYGQRPLDEFVELITYEDTREYVKRVVSIYARYMYLYRGKVYELPLTFDARHLKDGP